MPYLGAQPDKGNFADLNGAKLVIDADADTSLTADTDDQIDIEVAGADVLQIKNSSGDAIIKAAVDAKDILFQQYDGRTLLDVNDGGYVAIANGATGAGQLRLYEDTDNGTNYSAFQVGTQSGDVTYTLPTADGSSGQMLSTNGSGTLSWATAASADPTSADGDSLGTASAEWSDLYLADGGVIYFGNDQEITLTHVADDGLILKHVGTGDGKEPSLTFQAGDNDIAADDVLGSIFFQAPDEGAGTDAILVAAGIEAVSEGDFSSSNNATKLVFKTAASEAASTKMSLSSTGALTVGDGTAALPAYGNVGDAGTGWFFPSNDQIGMSTGTTERHRFNGAQVHFNDTANANLSAGLSINQAGNDDIIFALKSSDMAHGLTGNIETDTYFTLKKLDANAGGVHFYAMGESGGSEGRVFYGQCFAGNFNTTKGTGGNGTVTFQCFKNDSGTAATIDSDANLFAIVTQTDSGGQMKFCVDQEGQIHSDGGAQSAYDEFDDAQLIRAVDVTRGTGVIDSKFDKFIAYNHEKLADLKLVGRDEDGSPNHFINVTGMQRLHNGAIWQQYEKHENLLNAVYELAVKSVGQTEADKILEKHSVNLLDKNTLLN